MPDDLVRAIYQGNRILDWQDNLSNDEMPPEWMWIFEDELIRWFERLASDRENKNGGHSAPDDGSMMQNEYAAGRGR